MIQATVTDIVGPAIAAEDPDTLANQHICQTEQISGPGIVYAGETAFQNRNAFTLLFDAKFASLVGVEQFAYQGFTNWIGKLW